MNSNTLLTADKFVINNERIKSIYKSNGKSYNPYNVWPLVGGMGMRKRHFSSFRVTYLVKEARKGFSLHARAQSSPRCTRQLNESK